MLETCAKDIKGIITEHESQIKEAQFMGKKEYLFRSFISS